MTTHDDTRRLLAESQAREAALRAELDRLRAEFAARVGRRQCPTCGGSGYYPYPGNPHPSGVCNQCDGTGCELVYLSGG